MPSYSADGSGDAEGEGHTRILRGSSVPIRSSKDIQRIADLEMVIRMYLDTCTNEECEWCIAARKVLNLAKDDQSD